MPLELTLTVTVLSWRLNYGWRLGVSSYYTSRYGFPPPPLETDVDVERCF